MSKYADIIARLEKATRANFQLERDIDAFCYFGRPGALDRTPPPYTASIDAAIALVERMLPLHSIQIDHECRKRTSIYKDDGFAMCSKPSSWLSYADAPTAPLAILLALFRALDAQETQQ